MRISDWSSDVCSSDLLERCAGTDRIIFPFGASQRIHSWIARRSSSMCSRTSKAHTMLNVLCQSDFGVVETWVGMVVISESRDATGRALSDVHKPGTTNLLGRASGRERESQ